MAAAVLAVCRALGFAVLVVVAALAIAIAGDHLRELDSSWED